jgi:hypothetical protein
MWTTCGRKYYIPWVIKVNGEIVDKLDLTDKKGFNYFRIKFLG